MHRKQFVRKKVLMSGVLANQHENDKMFFLELILEVADKQENLRSENQFW